MPQLSRLLNINTKSYHLTLGTFALITYLQSMLTLNKKQTLKMAHEILITNDCSLNNFLSMKLIYIVTYQNNNN